MNSREEKITSYGGKQERKLGLSFFQFLLSVLLDPKPLKPKTPSKKISLKGKIFYEGFLKSWWVIVILLTTAIIYEPASLRLKENQASLQERLTILLKEKEIALETHKNLQLKINSQNDPDWIEMTLMKGLGLVPEGQIKVFFEEAP